MYVSILIALIDYLDDDNLDFRGNDEWIIGHMIIVSSGGRHAQRERETTTTIYGEASRRY